MDFEHLTGTFNLSAGSKPGLCGHNSNGKKDCCHCLNLLVSWNGDCVDFSGDLLSGLHSVISANTREECIALCQFENFKYAGLQNGTSCWCGNKGPSHGNIREGECDIPCPGNVAQICGSATKMNIFDTQCESCLPPTLSTSSSVEISPATAMTTPTTSPSLTKYTDLGSLIMIGGDTAYGATDSIETILGNSTIPQLPEERWGHNAFLLADSEVVVCGGKGQHHSMSTSKECISLPSLTSNWTKHSDLKQPRIYASAVTMTSGDVYLLGGWYSDMTSEVLFMGNSSWTQGPDLPDPLDSACALPLDDITFVTIGGGRDHSMVSRYNTGTKTWDHTWPQLPEGRRSHGCARLGAIIIVAGGFSYQTFEYTDSALTINAATGILQICTQ